jgi:hypothetical protein
MFAQIWQRCCDTNHTKFEYEEHGALPLESERAGSLRTPALGDAIGWQAKFIKGDL